MDTFYDVRSLTVKTKIAILKRALELSYLWHVDKLDCSVSWARQRTDISFEEVLVMLSNTSHFVVIHRRFQEEHGEIGFSTMTGIDYYLFIETTIENFETLINEFNLVASTF